jgi:hypothetical protein
MLGPDRIDIFSVSHGKYGFCMLCFETGTNLKIIRSISQIIVEAEFLMEADCRMFCSVI